MAVDKLFQYLSLNSLWIYSFELISFSHRVHRFVGQLSCLNIIIAIFRLRLASQLQFSKKSCVNWTTPWQTMTWTRWLKVCPYEFAKIRLVNLDILSEIDSDGSGENNYKVISINLELISFYLFYFIFLRFSRMANDINRHGGKFINKLIIFIATKWTFSPFIYSVGFRW